MVADPVSMTSSREDPTAASKEAGGRRRASSRPWRGVRMSLPS
jgi:hypothetical protein